MRVTVVLLLVIAKMTSSAGQRHGDSPEEIDAAAAATAEAEQQFRQIYRTNLMRMTKIMKRDINPCEDFFQHACGNFAKRENELDSQESSAPPPYLYDLQDRMEFFQEQSTNFGTELGKALASLYQQCKQRDQNAPLRRWLGMLQQIDFLRYQRTFFKQWPFLRSQWEHMEQQRAVIPNWIELAAQMAADGLPSFLNIYFAEDTIYIEPLADIKCPSRKDIARSLQALLGKRNAHVTNTIANELRRFCEDLRSIDEQKIATLTANVTNEDLNFLIDDLTNTYFQSFFMRLNLTENEVEKSRKIPLELARLSEVLKLMRFSSDRVITNYLLWLAFTSLEYPDCYQLTEEFQLLLDAEYWQWHAFDRNIGRNVALATYLYHTTRFQKQRKQMLLSEYWYKFLFKRLQKRDFNLERIMQQYASNYWLPEKLGMYYNITQIRPNRFYANLLTLRRQRLRYGFYVPYEDAEDVNSPLYFLHTFFNFCITLLKQPLYHYYATQGFKLWLESRILQDTDALYTALDCLERQSVMHSESKLVSFAMLSEMEVKDLYNFYSSFVESLRDYKFWLAGESFAFTEDFILEYFQLNSDQIMFYAVAQLNCGRNDPLYALQVNRAYMNMPEFQMAFNCSSEAAMNPMGKCMIRKYKEEI